MMYHVHSGAVVFEGRINATRQVHAFRVNTLPHSVTPEFDTSVGKSHHHTVDDTQMAGRQHTIDNLLWSELELGWRSLGN